MEATPCAPSAARRLDLDNLRNAAVLLLIVFHTARLFDGEAWHIKDAGHYWPADTVVRALNQWQMPVLFLLAGMAAWHALENRSVVAFLRERVLRLLVPLISGDIHRRLSAGVCRADCRRRARPRQPDRFRRRTGGLPAAVLLLLLPAGQLQLSPSLVHRLPVRLLAGAGAAVRAGARGAGRSRAAPRGGLARQPAAPAAAGRAGDRAGTVAAAVVSEHACPGRGLGEPRPLSLPGGCGLGAGAQSRHRQDARGKGRPARRCCRGAYPCFGWPRAAAVGDAASA
jgi:hypothetical protein